MRITHLFSKVFDLNHNHIYRGPEKHEAPASAEHEKLTPEEMRKELLAVAQRHLDSAKSVVREVEDIRDLSNISKRAVEHLAAVKRNISRLEAAIKKGDVPLFLLWQSKKTMQEHVARGLAPALRRVHQEGDPLGQGELLSYNADDYSTKIARTERVSKAEHDVLDAARQNTEYGTRNASSVNFALNQKFNRELTELAAARQLQRNRRELPSSGDTNLDLARELGDTMRLYDAAEAGQYHQEAPEAVLRRQARLMERILRKTGATKLSPGGVLDLGLVMIQRAKEGEAYLLTVAEGGQLDGKVATIPVSTVIDMGFEKQRSGLEKQIAQAQREADQAERALDRDYTSDRARARWEKATAHLDELQGQYDKLEPTGLDAFRGKPEQNANKVAQRMYDQLEGKQA